MRGKLKCIHCNEYTDHYVLEYGVDKIVMTCGPCGKSSTVHTKEDLHVN